jgi:hypothetical protein
VGAEADGVMSLNILEDARYEPLGLLLARHGDDLHIAVDSETSFVAVTGSHIRVCFWLLEHYLPYAVSYGSLLECPVYQALGDGLYSSTTNHACP